MSTLDIQRTPRYDFIVKQGAAFRRVIKFRDKETQELQSLDSFSSALLFARPSDTTSGPLEISTGGPDDKNIVIDKPNKQIIIYMADEVTLAINWSSAEYRFDLTDDAGDIFRRLAGKLKLEKKVI